MLLRKLLRVSGVYVFSSLDLIQSLQRAMRDMENALLLFYDHAIEHKKVSEKSASNNHNNDVSAEYLATHN